MALTTISYVAGSNAEFQLTDYTQLLIEVCAEGVKLWSVVLTGSPSESLWQFKFPAGVRIDQTSDLARNILDLALRSIEECDTIEDVHAQLNTTTAPLLLHYLKNNIANARATIRESTDRADHATGDEDLSTAAPPEGGAGGAVNGTPEGEHAADDDVHAAEASLHAPDDASHSAAEVAHAFDELMDESPALTEDDQVSDTAPEEVHEIAEVIEGQLDSSDDGVEFDRFSGTGIDVTGDPTFAADNAAVTSEIAAEDSDNAAEDSDHEVAVAGHEAEAADSPSDLSDSTPEAPGDAADVADGGPEVSEDRETQAQEDVGSLIDTLQELEGGIGEPLPFVHPPIEPLDDSDKRQAVGLGWLLRKRRVFGLKALRHARPLIAVLGILALIFPWHVAVALRMKNSVVFEDAGQSYPLKINPLTNAVTITVDDGEPISLAALNPIQDGLSDRVLGALLLESDMDRRARKAIDLYAMIIPYSIDIEVEGSPVALGSPSRDNEADGALPDKAETPTAAGDGAAAPQRGGEEQADPEQPIADGDGEAGLTEDAEPEVLVEEEVEPIVTSIKLLPVTSRQLKGTVGSMVRTPIEVQVIDQLGRPVAGQLVSFVADEGSGAAFSGSALTDSLGMATESWTLGTRAGQQQLEVRALGPGGKRETVTITASAAARPMASHELLMGDTVDLFVNERFDLAENVRVADRYGNPIDLRSLDIALSIPELMVVEEKTIIWTPVEMRGTFNLRLNPSLEPDRVHFKSYHDVTQHSWSYVTAERSCDARNDADSTYIVRNQVSAEYLTDSPTALPDEGLTVAFTFPEERTEITWYADGRVDTVTVKEQLTSSRLLAKQNQPNTLYVTSRWQDLEAKEEGSQRSYAQRIESTCSDGSSSFQSRSLTSESPASPE